MSELGFEEFLDSSHEGYIITSFKFPDHPNWVRVYHYCAKKNDQ
jgi:hypothetical protein